MERLFGTRTPVREPEQQQQQPDQTWQLPLVQAICVAMIRRIPNDWQSAYMAITPTERGFGYGLSHSAIVRDLSQGFILHKGLAYVMPDTDVMAATRHLELAWVEHDIYPFNQAIITATLDGKNWRIGSDYKY